MEYKAAILTTLMVVGCGCTQHTTDRYSSEPLRSRELDATVNIETANVSISDTGYVVSVTCRNFGQVVRMVPASLWLAQFYNDWSHMSGFHPDVPCNRLTICSAAHDREVSNVSWEWFFYPEDLEISFVLLQPHSTHIISITFPFTQRTDHLFEHVDSIAIVVPVFTKFQATSTSDSLVVLDSVQTRNDHGSRVLAYKGTSDTARAKLTLKSLRDDCTIRSAFFMLRPRLVRQQQRIRL